jgi:hypothetical protein
MRSRTRTWVGLLLLAIGLTAWQTAQSRPPIRNAFFNVYPSAATSRLYDLPSNAAHCGVCHFDFDGGGMRNHYGLAVEVAIKSGMYASNEDAIQAIEGLDHDNDGYSSLIEITDFINFTDTPTFPGLNSTNVGGVSNVTVSEITSYLTPAAGTETIPPLVTVTAPNGGETHGAHATVPVTWTASDASGIRDVDIFFSDDGGTTFHPVALNEPDDGAYDWFVPNRPGGNAIVRVRARDNAGNYGHDDGDGTFTVTGVSGGRVPTTMRDMDLPGSQPLTGVVLDDPDATCVACHGNYSTAVEPWYQWKGSMMAQAMRDPLFLACVAVAEQDAPSVGDLCLRCHTPGGWLEGRSVDTGGGMVTALDRQGVQCDFCHRLVDPVYTPGLSPPADSLVLAELDGIPYTHANGQFVADPEPARRGPYADAQANHSFYESPFNRECTICGTCHDVSNPVFLAGATPAEYVPNAFDAPHPDGNLRNMFPIERTYSEWTQSAYANGGVYAPQFAGNKADGIVSTCQDCHMKDLSGKGCDEGGAPTRSDLPHHDLTGGNTFIPDILPDFYPAEVDVARLQAGKARATAMLQMAASLALAAGQVGLDPTVTVTVTNETGHKLPSGYPEGRRIWLNVKYYDESMVLLGESGAYDASTGVLTHDADVKIYEIKPGVSSRLSPVVGLPVGPSFHFVLNDSVFSDNRIPPRGFTNAAFEAIQSQAVAHAYADSQYWDETVYVLPTPTRFVEVTLYYQTTTKEYVEFLRDENVTNTAGVDLYNAWVAHGRSAPVAMATDTISVLVDPTGVGDTPVAARTELIGNYPNPFNPFTTIRYSLAKRIRVRIDVYDVAGALVRTLVDEVRPAGVQQVLWEGNNRRDERVASGVYFVKMRAEGKEFVRKAVMLK